MDSKIAPTKNKNVNWTQVKQTKWIDSAREHECIGMNNIMTIFIDMSKKTQQGLRGNGYIRSETKRIPCSTSNLKIPGRLYFHLQSGHIHHIRTMSRPLVQKLTAVPDSFIGESLALNRKPKHNRTSWNVANFLAHHADPQILLLLSQGFSRSTARARGGKASGCHQNHQQLRVLPSICFPREWRLGSRENHWYCWWKKSG